MGFGFDYRASQRCAIRAGSSSLNFCTSVFAMTRTYTRRKRWIANLAINALVVAAFVFSNGWSQWLSIAVFLFALLPALVLYGQYIASMCCHQCGESYMRLPQRHMEAKVFVVFSSVLVPDACPHCGASAA